MGETLLTLALYLLFLVLGVGCVVNGCKVSAAAFEIDGADANPFIVLGAFVSIVLGFVWSCACIGALWQISTHEGAWL